MILARAPLRLTLGGGGTDLPSYYERYGGFVLSAALDKYVYVCINRPAADDLIRLKYSRSEEVEEVGAIEHDLVRPALETLGIPGNIEIASMADVPAGTGLGSSSTYLVALLTALHELGRDRPAPQALAELAFHIERDLAGHPVGKQDHYTAAFGGLVSLDIDPAGGVRVTPAPVSEATLERLRTNTILFFTGIRREAAPILERQRRDTEEDRSGVVEGLHAVKEIGLRVREALESGDVDRFGELLHEHWEAKKKRSAMISNGRVDRYYERARQAGATGGKLAGAGGGGFLVLYCPDGAKERVRGALREEGLREVPFDFDFDGAKVVVNF